MSYILPQKKFRARHIFGVSCAQKNCSKGNIKYSVWNIKKESKKRKSDIINLGPPLSNFEFELNFVFLKSGHDASFRFFFFFSGHTYPVIHSLV